VAARVAAVAAVVLSLVWRVRLDAAAADLDLKLHVAAVRVGDIADDNDLGGWAAGGKGGGEGCRGSCDLQTRISTCARTCWRGVPAGGGFRRRRRGGRRRPAATRVPTATPLTAPKSEPESLPSVRCSQTASKALFLRLAHIGSHLGVSWP